MLKQNMIEAINNQIKMEIYSSHLYLSLAAYYHEINLNGFANWMRIQAQEETQHALKFFDYLLDRGAKPEIMAVEAPQQSWNSPLDGFKHALNHEQKVTAAINDLANLSIKEADHATHTLLQWFIQEQVEEEASVNEIVDRLELAGDSPGGLFILDHDMRSRKAEEE